MFLLRMNGCVCTMYMPVPMLDILLSFAVVVFCVCIFLRAKMEIRTYIVSKINCKKRANCRLNVLAICQKSSNQHDKIVELVGDGEALLLLYAHTYMNEWLCIWGIAFCVKLRAHTHTHRETHSHPFMGTFCVRSPFYVNDANAAPCALSQFLC